MDSSRLLLTPELCQAISSLDEKELLDRLRVLALPMRVKFRGITHREVVLVKGPAGYGEFSPFPEYPAQEAAWWLASCLEKALIGLPAPAREKVAVNATIPAVTAEDVSAILDRYHGAEVIKIKVAEKGQTLDDDAARIAAVRAHAPQARLRLDANCAWTVDEAFDAAARFAPLDYIEQPCTTNEELKELKGRLRDAGIAVAIAADESVRRAEDPLLVADQQAADHVVLKVAPLGGVRRTLAIADYCHQAGISVTIASALDSAVGIYSGQVAASLLPESPAGLATGTFFPLNVADTPPAEGGYLPVCDPEIDEHHLATLAADPERTAWWTAHVQDSFTELRRIIGA